MHEINWERIRDVGDVITPRGFAGDAAATNPETFTRLDHAEHGAMLTDADGERFRLLGWGSVQGSVILADRYRRQFHADGATVLRP